MLTFADVENNWIGLHTILVQKGFDPAILEIESNAKGYFHDSISKRTFVDFIACFMKMISSNNWQLWQPISIPTYNQVDTNCNATISEYARNFERLISESQYCDRILIRYRILNTEKFVDFVEACLRNWSKKSTFRYEKIYSPAGQSQFICSECHENLIKRVKSLECVIIKKTQKLLGKI